MRGNKFIWLVLAILVIGGSFVFVLSALTEVTEPANTDNTNPRNVVQIEKGEPLYEIQGVISALDNNVIKISKATVNVNSDIPGTTTERTVVLSDKTIISAVVPLSEKEMANAIKEHAVVSKDNTNVSMPAPFKEVTITPSDLRLTMNINIISSEDVRTAPTITAEKISFIAPPSTPPSTNTKKK